MVAWGLLWLADGMTLARALGTSDASVEAAAVLRVIGWALAAGSVGGLLGAIPDLIVLARVPWFAHGLDDDEFAEVVEWAYHQAKPPEG